MNIFIQFLIQQIAINKNGLDAERVNPYDYIRQLKWYKIMRIRMKIGYHAWKREKTVKELILQTIIETFMDLRG
jgi:hypothetical protein